jgi:hypothetical protein
MHPFPNILDLFTLAPDYLIASLIFLGALMVANDLVRTALMVEMTRSSLLHATLNVLTLLPSFILAAVLVLSAWLHPAQRWMNLLWALLLYVAWYVGGSLTHLARRDTEGADPGFMTVGALVTFPIGILAALSF